jgi:hypothetical protein
VNVIDLEPPKITCPPDITVNLPKGYCNIIASNINLGNPISVSDNCALKYPITNNKSKTTYPVGENYVTWTISDSSNNAGTCTQRIIVMPVCDVPNKPVCSDSTTSTAKIKWQSVNCSSGYELRWRQEILSGIWGPWSNWSIPSGPGLLHTISGLKSNKYYNYQIRTKCGIANSESYSGYFHTKPGLNSDEFQKRNVTIINTDISNQIPLKINIVPNPARNNTLLLIEGFENSSKQIAMIDLSGKRIFHINLDDQENQLEIDLDKLALNSGIYLISVFDNKKQKTEQLVIER